MRDWERIRATREDLTDYVVHLTKLQLDPFLPPEQVFQQILVSGYIKPTFARLPSMNRLARRPTVKGPDAAVCLTEQPLWALLHTLPVVGIRYSGFGIAYHKVDLHATGGRPVLYGTNRELGNLIGKDDARWEPEKEIYEGGLPPHLQYLWVRYDPDVLFFRQHPIDFTWEREWRVKPRGEGLPLVLTNTAGGAPRGALILPKDRMIPIAQELLNRLTAGGATWTSGISKIISLESAQRGLEAGDKRFGRIETWPT